MGAAASTISGTTYTGGGTVWKKPTESSTGSTTAVTNPAIAQFGQAQAVASDMMSGAAYGPYRAAAREAMARTTAQQRASVAGQINAAGLAGQGLGLQLARSSENDLMAQRFQNQLQSAIAEQQMKQSGAALGLNLEQQLALEKQNAAENAAKNALASRGLDIQQQEANQTGQYQRGQLEIGRTEAATGATRAMNDYDIAAKQLALDTRELEQTGNYQNALINIQNKTLDSNERQAAAKLEYDYASLTQADKIEMAKIDLGREELTVKDKEVMTQLGISQQAQNWLEAYQHLSLGLEEKRIAIDERLAAVEESKVTPTDDYTNYLLNELTQKETKAKIKIADRFNSEANQ